MRTEIADPYRIPLEAIKPSKTNPRKNFNPEKLAQLAESIRSIGVIEPVLVRPLNGTGTYELVAGERRWRASKLAECTSIPAIVKEMDDATALEVQTIENLQRDDLHPLEEAAGYQALLKTARYDVGKLAARVGRSPKYVYDRLKLLQLIPKAQALFVEDRFTAGHAILLARLKPEDQERALNDEGGRGGRLAGLFEDAHGLPFDDEEFDKAAAKDPYLRMKPVSVKEFEGWIADAIRFDGQHVDPVLFPETARTLELARQDKQRVLLITREYRASDDVRAAGKDRVFGENSWKRADGKEGSKICERSRVGLVACGPGQGEAFLVCANKDKCEIHYGAEIRAREKRRKAAAKGGAQKAPSREDRATEQRKWEERRKREEAERLRWNKARPAILEALANAVMREPANACGLLAKLVIDGLHSYQSRSQDVEKIMPRGKTAESLVRHAAMIVVASQGVGGWRAADELVPLARKFNVDAVAIRDQAAPKVQTSAKKPAKRGTS